MSMTNMKILSEFSEVVKGRKFIKYNCECSCGNTKIVSKDNYPRTSSCGCARIESQKQYIGQTINKLSIITFSKNRTESRELVVYCHCECNKEKIIELALYRITKGLVKSCGCLQKETILEYKDLTGQKFGRLTVVQEAPRKKNKRRWICECECGTITSSIRMDTLTSGDSQSCGCLKKELDLEYKDLTGSIFGRLTVIQALPKIENENRRWICKCECGNTTNGIEGRHLSSGNTQSCGCLQKDSVSEYRDLTNEKFNRWTVLKEDTRNNNEPRKWICECECGTITEGIKGGALTSESTKSCGCLHKDIITKNILSNGINLFDISKEKDIPYTNLARIFKFHGEIGALDYIKNYGKGISSLEQFFQREFQIEFLNRKVLNNAKYRPDFKINDHVFINTDGLYRHREEQRGIKYHFDMTKDYESEGKRVLQFYEDEVYNKTDIVKSIINNVKGTTINKISARKCEIKEVFPKEAKTFFNENHLMGNLKSARCIGLYYQNTLVSALSYKIHSKKSKIEIARFGSLINTNVQGGFGKLLSAIEFLAKKLEITQIESFCDLRYATGKSYEKLGFVNKGDTLGWCWSDGKQRFNRLKCKAYEKDGLHISEAEHAIELGYYKIYDAGQRKYIKILA